MAVIKDSRLFFPSLVPSFRFGLKTLGPGATGPPEGHWMARDPGWVPVFTLPSHQLRPCRALLKDRGCKEQADWELC